MRGTHERPCPTDTVIFRLDSQRVAPSSGNLTGVSTDLTGVRLALTVERFNLTRETGNLTGASADLTRARFTLAAARLGSILDRPRPAAARIHGTGARRARAWVRFTLAMGSLRLTTVGLPPAGAGRAVRPYPPSSLIIASSLPRSAGSISRVSARRKARRALSPSSRSKR